MFVIGNLTIEETVLFSGIGDANRDSDTVDPQVYFTVWCDTGLKHNMNLQQGVLGHFLHSLSYEST